jgi:hypothetical protein
MQQVQTWLEIIVAALGVWNAALTALHVKNAKALAVSNDLTEFAKAALAASQASHAALISTIPQLVNDARTASPGSADVRLGSTHP